uniref:Uncharacterized protein n=1 Tax=Anguilla anguilla TaxID=7936 RepID=A0A0E9RSV5_ANGAN
MVYFLDGSLLSGEKPTPFASRSRFGVVPHSVPLAQQPFALPRALLFNFSAPFFSEGAVVGS